MTDLIRRIVQAVDAHPSAPALADLARSSDRGQVLAAAGGVASALDGARGRVVGVVASDVHELAAAAVGALAAGAVVLPIDRRQDPAATSALLAATGAGVVIVGGAMPLGRWARIPGTTTVRLADLGAAPLRPVRTSGTDPAILFASSGSSGTARAVIVTHDELALIRSGSEVAWAGPEGRLGMLLGATGTMVSRLLACLDAGVETHVLDATAAAPRELLDRFADVRVTMLDLVPTYLRRLLGAAPGPASLPDLAILTTIGEPLRWDDVARVRALLSDRCRVANRYGSTDCGRVSIGWVEPDEPLGAGDVHVGRALPGVDIHLLDEDGREIAQELDGGTVIGHVVVDTGMRRPTPGREDLPDGRSRYPTGDLGRRLPDGRLLLVGRRDRSVKVAGTRVDLSHVEEVLRRVPWVREAAVAPATSRASVPAHQSADGAPGDDTGGLVADVVGSPGPEGMALLDAELRRSLHAAVIPRRIHVHADPLPTLPSGKVDLKRLERLRAGSEVAPPSMAGRP